MSVETSVLFICPVFNEVTRVPLLIKSLNAQTDSNFSVVFVDSGSEDSTYEAISESTVNFQMSVIRFDVNQGVTRNWARALRVALHRLSFTHASFIAGDDTLSSNFVFELRKSITPRMHVTYAPDFQSEGGLSESASILGDYRATLVNLFVDWKLVHLVHSVFDRDFLSTRFLKILESTTSIAFDWWVVFLVIRETDIIRVQEAKYYKHKKSIPYTSNYYTAGISTGNHRALNFRGASLLDPLRKLRNLWGATNAVTNELGIFKSLLLFAHPLASEYKRLFSQLFTFKRHTH